MTDSEKIKAIEDMGIDLENDCPFEYGLVVGDFDCGIDVKCSDCWIKALENDK